MQQTVSLKKSILSQVGNSMLLYSMLSPVALGSEPFAIVMQPGMMIDSFFNRMQYSVEENNTRGRLFKGIGPFWVALGGAGEDRPFFSVGIRKALGINQNYWIGGYVYHQSGSPFTSWGAEFGREAVQVSTNFCNNLEGARVGGIQTSWYCWEFPWLGCKVLPHFGLEYIHELRPFMKCTIRLPKFLNCFAIDVKFDGEVIFGFNISGDSTQWLDRQMNNMPYLSISPKAHDEKIIYKQLATNRVLHASRSGDAGMLAAYWGRETSGYSDLLLDNAIFNAHCKIIAFLSEKGVAVNISDKDGYTTLHKASTYGHIDIAEFLLEKNIANVDEQNNRNQTALHMASLWNKIGIVELLLNNKANINILDALNQTPLHIASKKGHLAIVQILLAAGADVTLQDKKDNTALQMAKEHNHTEIEKLLINVEEEKN